VNGLLKYCEFCCEFHEDHRTPLLHWEDDVNATRKEIYAAIDGERNYQDERWPGHRHSVTEFLVYINRYVLIGMEKMSKADNDNEALPELRKIAALAVAAMEENGVQFRT
jgi:hypothetical protein